MKKRTLLALGLILTLALSLGVPALAAVDLSSPAYVVDDANVLSAALEEQIIQANQTLEYDCSGAQFVVVTVKFAPAGYDREEYAKEIFDTWHIGSQSENNGMLLVAYTGDNEFWLECGYGIYNSPYVDEIAAMVDDSSTFSKAIQSGDFEKAVSSLLTDITDWYTDYYGSTANNGAPHSYGNTYGGNAYTYSQPRSSSGSALLTLVVLVLIFIIVTSPFRCRRRWGHWGVWPFFYFSPWWRTRTRVNRGFNAPRYGAPPPWESTHRSGGYRTSSRPSSGFGSRPSSGSSFRGGGGRSGGGFGSSGGFRSGGSSFRGGGGHSGGGFGRR